MIDPLAVPWRLATALLAGALCSLQAAPPEKPGPPVQVPEDLQLFLLIGQSNMSGRGVVEPDDREIISQVLTLDKNLAWVPAIDPIHLERISGVSMGRTFGRTLVSVNPTCVVGLIPSAVGSSSLEMWKRGGGLYENAVRRTKAALKGGRLRGILWHQGEGDGILEADALTYGVRWSKFISALRADLGAPDAPVIVGELCRSIYQRPDEKTKFALQINQQLALMSLSVPHVGFVSSEGLIDKGDYTHFDSASQRELGRRYALAFLALDPTWAPIPRR